jgi:hypothetical protein
MHWKRYERLRGQHDLAEDLFCVFTAANVLRINQRLSPGAVAEL